VRPYCLAETAISRPLAFHRSRQRSTSNYPCHDAKAWTLVIHRNRLFRWTTSSFARARAFAKRAAICLVSGRRKQPGGRAAPSWSEIFQPLYKPSRRGIIPSLASNDMTKPSNIKVYSPLPASDRHKLGEKTKPRLRDFAPLRGLVSRQSIGV